VEFSSIRPLKYLFELVVLSNSFPKNKEDVEFGNENVIVLNDSISPSLYNFEVLGKPHELAVWGRGNFQPEQMIADCQKIIEVESQMFGGLPYDR
jgi:predicted metalloprotease with PDZ domain